MVTNRENKEAAERRMQKLIAITEKAEREAPGIWGTLKGIGATVVGAAAAGGCYGAAFGGIGAIPGALGGAVVGLVEGCILESVSAKMRQAKIEEERKAVEDEQ